MLEPANGSLIRSMGPMTLRARMSDLDGVVESVRFYEGTNFLGLGIPSGSNEFALTWTPGRTGNFSLYASAIDNGGSTGITATVLISVATNPPVFSVIELETSQTNTSFDPWAINSQRVVVGSITNSAARWSQWQTEVFDVFGKSAVARAISDNGTIVGEFVQAHNQQYDTYQPFCYSPDRGVLQLPELTYGYANVISRAGIVGFAATNSSATSFLGYQFDGTNYAFFNGGGLSCYANDINDDGVIVGSLLLPPGDAHPFIYRAGEMTLLSGGAGSGANAINRHGQVVGTTGGEAFLYEHGTMTYMGTLGTVHSALDINDDGKAVGYYYPYGTVNSPSAFLFSDGVMIDLNQLIPINSGWSLQTARSINNGNWIIGKGSRAGRGSQGFLLVPGPIMNLTNATATALEGRAYFVEGTAVFERSTDLINWTPLATNTSSVAEAPFSLAFDLTERAAFFRVVQTFPP